ncbi:phage terminase family protein [Halosquirtibacter laminarini]|uniref:Phage terminase family protein n=1 Tax=Halosquirtibacter laminarini TaxID=3374600 RepID=A0AC61NI01_9BACT|nr:phage terminase family protein [Prolixibacteraceae bacterium]
MSEPTKELERIIYKGEADLMSDPVKHWMFRNVVVYKDINENVKADKKRSRDKIVGVITDTIAIGCSMAGAEDLQDYITYFLKYISMKFKEKPQLTSTLH